MVSQLQFPSPITDGFASTVRKRVQDYFKENDLPTSANREMKIKAALLLGAQVGIYLMVLLANSPVWVFVAWASLGAVTALAAINVCHDAVHGALFHSARKNNRWGLLFNVYGANDFIWRIAHNQLHHSYTNVQGHDSDVDLSILLRITPSQEWRTFHRFQQGYVFFLYPLTTLQWVTIKDFILLYKKLGKYTKLEYSSRQHLGLYLFKVLHMLIFLVVPALFQPLWIALVGFVVMHLVEGMIMALIFNVGHLVEGTDFQTPNDKQEINCGWAEMQLMSAANFGTGNRLVNFICGGLNFQIEHHLFPQVCHIHYPKIAPIVKETAAEFNLPYADFDSYLGALQSHYRFLKGMGEKA